MKGMNEFLRHGSMYSSDFYNHLKYLKEFIATTASRI